MSIENNTFDFIEAAIAELEDGDPLFGLELHETVYNTIKKEFGVRVGDCESDLAPSPGGATLQEFDGMLTLVCFAKVTGTDKTSRMTARDLALDIAKAMAKLFLDDPTMGGRVQDSRVLSVPRGYDSIGSTPYAVCNVRMIINETGQLN